MLQALVDAYEQDRSKPALRTDALPAALNEQEALR